MALLPYADDLDESEEGIVTPTEADTSGSVTLPAPIVAPIMQLPTQFGALKMNVWLEASPEWCSRFKSASCTDRSILLSQILEAFNDGAEGINISFSEPE